MLSKPESDIACAFALTVAAIRASGSVPQRNVATVHTACYDLEMKGCIRAIAILVVMTFALCIHTTMKEKKRADEDLCSLTKSQPPISVADFKMVPLCDHVWAEPGLTSTEEQELKRAYHVAQQNIVRAFGQPRGSTPLTFFCRSAACKIAFGAAPESASAADLGFARDGVMTSAGFMEHPTVIVTGPVARTASILTHELVHAEMKAWVPYDSLPTWFNEGVATLIADEPKCDAYPSFSELDMKELDTKKKWQASVREPGQILPTYCKARHRVAAWAASFGGDKGIASALRRLMTTVAQGGSFESAFADVHR